MMEVYSQYPASEPEIICVRGHYEAYFQGKFLCSGDTYREVEKEIEDVE